MGLTAMRWGESRRGFIGGEVDFVFSHHSDGKLLLSTSDTNWMNV
jgi:hypothetical protein